MELTTLDGFGPHLIEPFAIFNRHTLSWKMFQDSSQGEWETYSDRWPSVGMMRNGLVYDLQILERHIDGEEYLLLLPTPTAYDTGRSVEKHLENKEKLGGRKMITSLSVLARAEFRQPKLPTIISRDVTTPGKKSKYNSLSRLIKLLPTLTANMSKGPGGNREGGMNLQTAISEVMNQQLEDGKEYLDPAQTQLTKRED